MLNHINKINNKLCRNKKMIINRNIHKIENFEFKLSITNIFIPT